MSNNRFYQGKRKDTGEWIVGFYNHVNYYDNMIDIIWETKYFIRPIVSRRSFEVYAGSVGQSVGIEDIYKKDIFEGDIVKCTTFEGNQHSGVVAWNEEECRFFVVDLNDETISYEIHANNKYERLGHSFDM